MLSARRFLIIMVIIIVFLLMVSLLFPSGWQKIPYNDELYQSIWGPEEVVKGILEANEKRYLIIYGKAEDGSFSADYLKIQKVRRIKDTKEHLEIIENPWFYKLESSLGTLEENDTNYMPIRYGENTLPGGPDFLEEFVGKEVELFGKRLDIKKELTPNKTLIFGIQFIPKRIREVVK